MLGKKTVLAKLEVEKFKLISFILSENMLILK